MTIPPVLLEALVLLVLVSPLVAVAVSLSESLVSLLLLDSPPLPPVAEVCWLVPPVPPLVPPVPPSVAPLLVAAPLVVPMLLESFAALLVRLPEASLPPVPPASLATPNFEGGSSRIGVAQAKTSRATGIQVGLHADGRPPIVLAEDYHTAFPSPMRR